MTRASLATGAVLLIALAFGAGFLVAGFFGASPSPQPSASPSSTTSMRPTASPRPTPMRSPTPTPTVHDTSVTASAVVVPIQSADLSVGVSGIVSDVLVAPDQKVTANQLLLRLDQDSYNAAVNVAQTDVTHQQAAVRSAQLAVDQLPTDASQDQIDAAEAQLELAQSALAQANAQLNQAQVAVRQTEVHAPFAGTVASVEVAPGEQAVAGQPVVTIADLTGWLIQTTDLSELEVVRIAVGGQATITFGALPDLTLHGTVTSIQVRGTSDQGGVLFAVVIKPDQFRPDLRWNMSATVHIQPSS